MKPSILHRFATVALASTLIGASRAADAPSANDALANAAATVFGKQKGQSFDASAVKGAAAAPRTESITLTLAPGKGAELKALIDKGQGFVFHWSASAEVAVDMHGEREGAKDEYTSYAIHAAQRDASGSFTAGFDGLHGWFWHNRGKHPVNLRLTVTGFQKKLVRPEH